MKSNLYNGFSTTITRGADTGVHDIDLVNADIANRFNTPLRSRVGRADFGSIIPLLLFELGDPTTQNLINADVDRNIKADPRVTLANKIVNVNLDQHSVEVRLLLNYVELDTTDWLVFSVGIRA